MHGWGGEASLHGHLCGYLQSRAWSPEGQLCLLCLRSIPQGVILTPISLSGDHPHPQHAQSSPSVGDRAAFPLKCVIWDTGDGIIGEKVFYYYYY